jgi:hypothetical protein
MERQKDRASLSSRGSGVALPGQLRPMFTKQSCSRTCFRSLGSLVVARKNFPGRFNAGLSDRRQIIPCYAEYFPCSFA